MTNDIKFLLEVLPLQIYGEKYFKCSTYTGISDEVMDSIINTIKAQIDDEILRGIHYSCLK